MGRAVVVAWSVFTTAGMGYLAVVAIAATALEARPWFAYPWQTWILVVCGLAAAVGFVLLAVWGIRAVVRRISLTKKAKFEEAVAKEVEKRVGAKRNPVITVSVPGSYSYTRGTVTLNIKDKSLAYKWKNGVLAATALAEGQGYRVYNALGSEIGTAKDRDSVVALVEGHYPEEL